eukprot:6379771-Alexandrium_andersonii.AAC.1
MGGRQVSTTLTKRIEEGCKAASRVAALPLSFERRLALVAGEVLPMSLYGAQVSAVPRSALGRLKARIALAMDQTMARNRAVEAVLDLAFPKELDPVSHIAAM